MVLLLDTTRLMREASSRNLWLIALSEMASLAPPNPLEVFGPTIMKCFFFLPSLGPVTCLALG